MSQQDQISKVAIVVNFRGGAQQGPQYYWFQEIDHLNDTLINQDQKVLCIAIINLLENAH